MVKDLFNKEEIEEVYKFVKSLDIEEEYRKILFEILLSRLTNHSEKSSPSSVRVAESITEINDDILRLILREKEAVKSHSDIVLLFAYYLTSTKKIDTFTVNHIKELYEHFRLAEPANISDILARLKKRGLIKNIGRKSNQMLYQITLDGEKKVIKMIRSENKNE